MFYGGDLLSVTLAEMKVEDRMTHVKELEIPCSSGEVGIDSGGWNGWTYAPRSQTIRGVVISYYAAAPLLDVSSVVLRFVTVVTTFTPRLMAAMTWLWRMLVRSGKTRFSVGATWKST